MTNFVPFASFSAARVSASVSAGAAASAVSRPRRDTPAPLSMCVRSRSGSMVTRGKTLVSVSTPWIAAATMASTPAHCSRISRMHASIQLCIVLRLRLADVNTVLYSCDIMSDLLSAKDWLDQGIKALAANGVSALKAEPLAKAMGVSRGSFYWHFADIGAFRTAILAYWREVSAERVIADLEAEGAGKDALL